MVDMDTTANNSNLGSADDTSFTEMLSSAIEKLRTGVLEEAHKLLVRLIRKHNSDADVIFNLAVARKRLGYDVSADALFRQAFEHGYQFPDDSPAEPLEDKPDHYRWSDPTDTVRIIVHQRPRRSALTFVGFEDELDDDGDDDGEDEVLEATPTTEDVVEAEASDEAENAAADEATEASSDEAIEPVAEEATELESDEAIEPESI